MSLFFNNNIPILSRFIQWLCDTSMGVPGPKGHWPAWLTITFHGSNLVTGLCLCCFPFLVLYLWKIRRDDLSQFRFWKVAAFLPVLGVSRILRSTLLFGPPYHLIALVEANASVATVFCLCCLTPFINHIMQLPSREELQKVNDLLLAKTAACAAEKEASDARHAALLLTSESRHGALLSTVEAALKPARDEDREKRLAALEAVASELRGGLA